MAKKILTEQLNSFPKDYELSKEAKLKIESALQEEMKMIGSQKKGMDIMSLLKKLIVPILSITVIAIMLFLFISSEDFSFFPSPNEQKLVNGVVGDNKELYIGHISIQDDTLYLDEVEWITEEHIDRIKTLGLSQSDMPNGYYINNPSSEKVPFEITRKTEYHFIALESLSFFKEGEDRNYRTTKKDEFIEFLNSMDSEKAVFWIEVKDRSVIKVTEQFTN